MTTLDLTTTVREAARAARTHNCTVACPSGNAGAFGFPPHGWHDKLAVLLDSKGYALERSWVPVQMYGERTNGLTIGEKPPCVCGQCPAGLTCYYRPRETKAAEFSTAVHEACHVILGHQDNPKGMDHPDDELPVRLAVIGVTAATGMRVPQSEVCQVSRFTCPEHSPLTSEHEHAAMHAARVILGALSAREKVAA